jgi:hypothetical protein
LGHCVQIKAHRRIVVNAVCMTVTSRSLNGLVGIDFPSGRLPRRNGRHDRAVWRCRHIRPAGGRLLPYVDPASEKAGLWWRSSWPTVTASRLITFRSGSMIQRHALPRSRRKRLKKLRACAVRHLVEEGWQQALHFRMELSFCRSRDHNWKIPVLNGHISRVGTSILIRAFWRLIVRYLF